MEINLSEETINTIYNSLKCSKHSLKLQIRKEKSANKIEIIKHQIAEVEDALQVFEEFMN